MKDPTLTHTWLRLAPRDSLFSFLLAFALADPEDSIHFTSSHCARPLLLAGLCVGDTLATPYCLDTLSFTSLSHGKMAALVLTVAATCFRTHSQRRVIALLSSLEHYSYYRKVGVFVDTIYNFLYTLNLFRIVPAEYNIHKGYYYSTKPRLHRAQQSPSLRAHF